MGLRHPYASPTNSPYLLYYAAVLVLIGVLPFILIPADWAGWLLVYVTLLIPLSCRCIRAERFLLFAVIVAIVAHHAVSIVNANFATVPGADLDAVTFHRGGAYLAQQGGVHFTVGYKSYQNLLGLFYGMAGVSLFLGQGLSVLAFTISCVGLVKILDLLDVDKHRAGAVLIFGLMPVSLFLGAVTLRESWEVMFFILTVYCGLRVYLSGSSLWLTCCLLSAAGLGVFHKGLVLYSMCVIALFLLCYVYSQWSAHRMRKRLLIHVGIVTGGIGLVVHSLTLSEEGRGLVLPMLSGDVWQYIEYYRDQIDGKGHARTPFTVAIDYSSPVSTTLTFIKIYIYYLFAPLSGDIANLKDFYSTGEMALRFVLLVFSVTGWHYAKGDSKAIYGLMLICYLSMTFMWALGTTNTGQAVRHHMVTNWIVIVLGYPVLASVATALKRHSLWRSAMQS